MKIYGISGLGADSRVFNYLSLDYSIIPLIWIDPNKNESIEHYSIRLSKQINTDEHFGIQGVSFGGLIAVEISKILKPDITILISSAETKKELRLLYKGIGKTRLTKLIPEKFFDIPRGFAKFLFGTERTELLNNILDDTDLAFTKWAIGQLINWNNKEKLKNCLKISGTHDKLLPSSNDREVKRIQGGEHFMIVDKAKEISDLINERIKLLLCDKNEFG